MINMAQSGYDLFSPRTAQQGYTAGRSQAGRQKAYGRPRPRYQQDQEAAFGANPAGNPQPVNPQVNNATQINPQYQDFNSVMGGGPAAPQGTGVQLPSQFGAAEQMYQNAATNPYFGQAAAGYGSMMENGMPTDQSASYQAQKGVAQQDILDAMKQMQEQMGGSSMGKRYSSAMGRGNQEIASKRMGEFAQATTAQEMGAQEAARQRQLQAMGGMLGTASGYGQNAMNAGQGYQGLGNDINSYGMNLANQSYQMGSGLYGVQQNQANDLGNYWSGNQWYNNPALQGLQQGSQYSPDYAYPQYKQSGVGQGISAVTGILKSIFG